MVMAIKNNIMKNYFNKILVLALIASTIFIVSCKKETFEEAPRLFRPSLKGELLAPGNYIEFSWQKMKTADGGYIAEISIDTFKTITKSIHVLDTNMVIFEDLLWEQLYQVQVYAVSKDESKNSRASDFGAIKTPKFPTIVEDFLMSEFTSKSILFKWRNEGEAVTQIKVLNGVNGEEIKVINLTPIDIENGYFLVDDLTPETKYKVELYSAAKFRGANTYTTKAALIGNIIDLSELNPATLNLVTEINNAAAGSTIVLKRGAVYNLPAININKTIKFISSEDPFVVAKANLHFESSNNFNLPNTNNASEILFEDIKFSSNDAGGKYIFNPSNAGTVASLTFENCEITALRGVARFRGGIIVETLKFNNCVIDSIGGYGILTVDDANAKVNNIIITNSTISRAEKVLVSKNASVSIRIDDCTFYRAPLGNNYILDWNGVSVTGDIYFNNNILSTGKATTATPPVTTINGLRGTFIGSKDASNNFGLSDFGWSNAATELPGITLYGKTSKDIFRSVNTGDFTIIDGGFGGKANAGDPRWRVK
jgi:hypothetical protein